MDVIDVTGSTQQAVEIVTDLISTWGIQVVGAIALLLVGRWAAGMVRRGVRRSLEKGNVDNALVPFFSPPPTPSASMCAFRIVAIASWNRTWSPAGTSVLILRFLAEARTRHCADPSFAAQDRVRLRVPTCFMHTVTEPPSLNFR